MDSIYTGISDMPCKSNVACRDCTAFIGPQLPYRGVIREIWGNSAFSVVRADFILCILESTGEDGEYRRTDYRHRTHKRAGYHLPIVINLLTNCEENAKKAYFPLLSY